MLVLARNGEGFGEYSVTVATPIASRSLHSSHPEITHLKTPAKTLLLLLTALLLAACSVRAIQASHQSEVVSSPAPNAVVMSRTAPAASSKRNFVQTLYPPTPTGAAVNQTLMNQAFISSARALLDVELSEVEYLRWKAADYCARPLSGHEYLVQCDTVDRSITPIDLLEHLERAALLGSDQALHEYVDSAAVGTADYDSRVRNLLLSTAAQGRTTALVLLAQYFAGQQDRASLAAAIGIEYAATVNGRWGSMGADGPTMASGWTFNDCAVGVQQGYLLASSLFPQRSEPLEQLDVARICARQHPL